MSMTATQELLCAIRETLVWEKPFVTPREASDDQGVGMLPWSQRTIEQMCRDGEIPARKKRGKWMLCPSEIAAWIGRLPPNVSARRIAASAQADDILGRLRRERRVG